MRKIVFICRVDGQVVDKLIFDRADVDLNSNGLCKVYRCGKWWPMNTYEDYCRLCRHFNFYLDDEADGEIANVEVWD